ncbi:hypothetical protein ACFXCZ_01325 [Streptomyces sp. NPDC059396]|uniref:hypothetical protein n=1 Tax=Streptomyces sp. NPDC059396 TaxID=3346819 RepID=UPI0036ACD501
MSRFDQLLGTDFDDRPAADPDEVIYGGLDDPRHRDRVPGLTEMMSDTAAPARHRFLACLALTTWGESAGYEAVIRAAGSPAASPWYKALTDRKFSVDSTFAQLAIALGDSAEPAAEKRTAGQREAAFRALVRIADSEYFEEQLGDLMPQAMVALVLPDIAETVERGAKALAPHPDTAPPAFDLATQLVDLASAAALVDGPLAAHLAMVVLEADASPKALVHAVTVLHRSKAPDVRQLGEYMMSVGDDRVRKLAADALSSS